MLRVAFRIGTQAAKTTIPWLNIITGVAALVEAGRTTYNWYLDYKHEQASA